MHGRERRSAGSVLPGWGLSESQHCSPALGCALLGWLSQCDTWPCPVIYHGKGRLVKTGFILFPLKSTVGCLSEYLLSPARACSRMACSPTAFLGMWDADIPYSRLPSQPHPFPSPVSMMEGLTLEALGLKNLCSEGQKRQFWGESWIFPSAVCITGDQWKTKCPCLHVLHSLQPPACMPSSSRTDTIWLRLEVFVPGFSFYFPSFISFFSFLNSRAILSSALHQQRGRQPGNLNLEASVCCFWLWAGSGFGAEMLSELKWLSDRIRETNPGELVRASRHGAAWQQRSKPTFQHRFGSSHLILQKLSVPGNGVGSTMLGGQGRPQWEASLLGCISALFLALTSPPSCMEILVSRAMFAGSGLWKVIAARGPCSPALLLPADVCISCSVAARRKNHVLEIKNCSNCRKMPFLASPGCLPLPLIQQFVRTWYAVQMPLL